MKPIFRAFIVFFFAVAASGFAESPDLVVVISIDQFPYEYLERFGPYFAAGGFQRLRTSGANFSNAHYPYATTFTGPGHATIGTGLSPSRSGIVANAWFDRLASTPEYCVEDTRAQASASGAAGMSPINLAEDSLGDRLRGVAQSVVFQTYTPVRYFGQDTATGSPIYREEFTNALNPGRQFSTADLRSRWQARLGLRVSF